MANALRVDEKLLERLGAYVTATQPASGRRAGPASCSSSIYVQAGKNPGRLTVTLLRYRFLG